MLGHTKGVISGEKGEGACNEGLQRRVSVTQEQQRHPPKEYTPCKPPSASKEVSVCMTEYSTISRNMCL